MSKRFLATWDLARTSLRLVPSLMVLAGALLAWAVDAGQGGEDEAHARQAVHAEGQA